MCRLLLTKEESQFIFHKWRSRTFFFEIRKLNSLAKMNNTHGRWKFKLLLYGHSSATWEKRLYKIIVTGLQGVPER